MMIGYGRVSTVGQSLDVQIEALKAAGCEVVRSEKKSGTTTEGREELETLLAFLREGDVLIVTKIDRLARSITDLLAIVARLRGKGAALRTVDGMAFDDSPTGRLLLSILGVIAEFENSLRKERQMAGIQAAKAAGKYKGRRKSDVDPTVISALAGEGKGAAEIARSLNVSRATIYRRAAPGTFAGTYPFALPSRPTFNIWAGDRLIAEGFDTPADAQAEAARLSDAGVTYEIRPSNE